MKDNTLSDIFTKLLDFHTTADLLSYDFVQQAVLAAALLGLLAGAIGPLIVSRQMSFAVHGTSELSLTGAAAALLAGIGVGAGAIIGSVVAAVLFGLLGSRARERDSVIAVVLSFGLGLSVLFLWLGPTRAGSKFSLLTGQVVSVGNTGLSLLSICTVGVLLVLAFVYRPLLFASTDPEVAVARGVPVRALSVVFAVLLGITAAFGVQIVGALLVLSLLITPAAAAAQLTASPLRAAILSIVFAEIAAVGGIVLSLAPGVPVSTFVTTISFAIYLIARLVGSKTRGARRVPVPA
ncbi:zinc/manganese transport system permease protein [Nocardia sp. GAS34]|uniref:metal ABC transporter permease n=1 Tax=unclassified Nocardia TaxID=2637762 RepID=UPI003D21F2B0